MHSIRVVGRQRTSSAKSHQQDELFAVDKVITAPSPKLSSRASGKPSRAPARDRRASEGSALGFFVAPASSRHSLCTPSPTAVITRSPRRATDLLFRKRVVTDLAFGPARAKISLRLAQ